MQKPRFGLAKAFLLALVAFCAIVRLAHGYGWCVEYWNWDGRRTNSRDGRRWPAGDGAVISYINGIFHSIPEWEKITGQLEALFGHEVRPFYNPSSGWWITDASKAGYHLLRKPANYSIAQALGEHLAQAVEDVGKGRVLHIAHSGGALITYLAAQNHLTRRQRDKIDVLTFGGARSITRKYFSGRVVNYYSRNDPLVKLDRRAAELMKSTSNSTVQAILDKHNSTFVFLEGRARQFVLDHSLEGPTYQHVLKKEARAFRRSHFGPLSPLSWDYDTSLVRLVRKRMARVSGVRHFLSTEYWSIQSWRKSMARFTGLSGFFVSKASGDGGGKNMVVVDEVGGAQPPEKSSWFSQRWDWPWRKGSDQSEGTGDGKGLVVMEHGDSEPVSAQPSRWFLGWRWYPATKTQQLEQEVSVDDDATGPAMMGEAAKSAPESEKSNSGRLWNIWGFQSKGTPEQESGEVDGEASSGDVLSDSEEIDGLGRSGEVDALLEGRTKLKETVSPVIDSKPWLSLGWTPWGVARKPTEDGDGVATMPINGVPTEQTTADGEDDGGDINAGGGASSNSDASTREEAKLVLQKNEVALVEEGQSSLRPVSWWWIGSSQRHATSATLEDNGADDKVEGQASSIIDDDRKVEQAQPTTVQKTEATLAEEGQSSLRSGGWWWSGSSQREITPSVIDAADPVKEGEGKRPLLDLPIDGIDGKMSIGGVEEQIVALSAAAEQTEKIREIEQARPLLRRWWPLQTPEEAVPAATVVVEEAAVEESDQLDLSTALAEDEKYPHKSVLRETEATVVEEPQHPSFTSTPTASSQPSTGWRLWSVFKGDTTGGTSNPKPWTEGAPDQSMAGDEEQSGEELVGGILEGERLTGEVIWGNGHHIAAAGEWSAVQPRVKEALGGQGSGDDDDDDDDDEDDDDDDDDDDDAAAAAAGDGPHDDEEKRSEEENGRSPPASVPSLGETEVFSSLGSANVEQVGDQGENGVGMNDVPGNVQSELARRRNDDVRKPNDDLVGRDRLAEISDEATRNGEQEDSDEEEEGEKPTQSLLPDLPSVATVNRAKDSASTDPDKR